MVKKRLAVLMAVKPEGPLGDIKDLLQKELKLVPLFIQLMTSNGAIWVFRSNDCHNKVFITSLQGVIKRPLKDFTCSSTVY